MKISKKNTSAVKINRNKIIKSATKNFSKNGYVKTSMMAIAESANMSKGGMYHYFSSKEELFLAVIFQDIETDLSKGSELFKKREKLREDLETYYDDIINKPIDLMRVWLEGNTEAMYNVKLKKMLQQGRQQAEEMSIGMLKQIQKNMNLLQDYSDSELPEIANGILNLYTGMTVDRILENDRKSIKPSWVNAMHIILTSKKLFI